MKIEELPILLTDLVIGSGYHSHSPNVKSQAQLEFEKMRDKLNEVIDGLNKLSEQVEGLKG